MLDLKGMDS